jgi:hypothetical protein
MRVFRYYGELKPLELQAQESPHSRTPVDFEFEHRASRQSNPTQTLCRSVRARAHVQMVRRSLQKRFGAADSKNSRTTVLPKPLVPARLSFNSDGVPFERI